MGTGRRRNERTDRLRCGARNGREEGTGDAFSFLVHAVSSERDSEDYVAHPAAAA